MNGIPISNKRYPTEPKHLDEYAFVTSGAEVLLGKCGELDGIWARILQGAIKVENAYVILGGYAPTKEGTIVRPRVLTPIETFASADYKIVVPDHIFPLSQLDKEDQQQVLREIADAEKRRTQLRAKNSGLVMPGM
jgi:hypothetical protein